MQLTRDLPVGAVVVMKNARGAQVSARVVAQLTAIKGVSTYGIEFVEHFLVNVNPVLTVNGFGTAHYSQGARDYIPTAPASLTAILQEPDLGRRNLSSLRFVVSGGA